MVLAALFFYLQRSYLAWYYGQIALAQSLGSAAQKPLDEWLESADGWDTWLRYQFGFIALAVSSVFYAFAIGEALYPSIASLPYWLTVALPLTLGFLVAAVRNHVLSKFPYEDRPFATWWRLGRNR